MAISPNYLINWYGWYRADAAYTGSVGNGNAITTWQDKSGNGFDLTLSTGTAKPTWATSDTNLNSQPVVTFASASSQSLEVTNSQFGNAPSIQPVFGSTEFYTICAVVDFTTVAAAMRIFTHTITSGNRGFGITATPNWETRMGSTSATGGTPATATKYFVRVYATNAAHTLFVNETSTATTATTATALTQFVLGAQKNNTPAYSNFFNGKMAEVGIYKGDITAHAHWPHYKYYLNTRYGFSLTIP